MRGVIKVGGVIMVAGMVSYLLGSGCTSPSEPTRVFSPEELSRYQDAKEAALERLLGPMHPLVGHAIVPFGVEGGAVDMYYFPNGIPGVGFATMELIAPDGSGPRPNRMGTYELVAFTRLKMLADRDTDPNQPFNRIEDRLCRTMTVLGLYTRETAINPGETCEIPLGDGKPNLCLLFDEYRKAGVALEIAGRKHCLLLCLEVFRSEMEYAMRHGSSVVLQKLKEAGYYPYSDMDRKPVF